MSGSKPCTMFPLQVMRILSIIWYIIVSFKVHTNNLVYHCVHTISKRALCAETFCKYFREIIFTGTLKWQISQSMRELVQSFFWMRGSPRLHVNDAESVSMLLRNHVKHVRNPTRYASHRHSHCSQTCAFRKRYQYHGWWLVPCVTMPFCFLFIVLAMMNKQSPCLPQVTISSAYAISDSRKDCVSGRFISHSCFCFYT